MPVGPDGSLQFFSRRESVKGGFPERTAQLPHLTSTKLPQFAGNVYNVELIHTGKGVSEVESPARLAGILNSGVEKSIASQTEHGPVRVVLHNVITPEIKTYREKLLHLKEVEKAYGNQNLLWVDNPVLTLSGIHDLVQKTKREGREGIIVTSLSLPEGPGNPRIKVVHRDHFNLVVTGVDEEVDKHGKPKGSMGALIVSDASGKVVGRVGTGFLREDRQKPNSYWMGKLIQVSSRGFTGNALKMPVYHGDADGELDLVS